MKKQAKICRPSMAQFKVLSCAFMCSFPCRGLRLKFRPTEQSETAGFDVMVNHGGPVALSGFSNFGISKIKIRLSDNMELYGIIGSTAFEGEEISCWFLGQMHVCPVSLVETSSKPLNDALSEGSEHSSRFPCQPLFEKLINIMKNEPIWATRLRSSQEIRQSP